MYVTRHSRAYVRTTVVSPTATEGVTAQVQPRTAGTAGGKPGCSTTPGQYACAAAPQYTHVDEGATVVDRPERAQCQAQAHDRDGHGHPHRAFAWT